MLQNVRNFFNDIKPQFLILAGIVILGFLLRLIGLNKPDGFWYDEMRSYSFAIQSFPFGIVNKLYLEEFHAPLYYLFLHIWIKLANNNELIIRLSSFIFGILSIPLFYLAGKEVDSRKTGIFAAALVAVNSFLIYYSQEVRFYSLLILQETISILYIIKLFKEPSKKNIAVFTLINLTILYTYSFGCIFMFIKYAVLALYAGFKRKEIFKPFITSGLLALAGYLPYVPTLIKYVTSNEISLSGNFWWINFKLLSSPILILHDWFTPLLINIRSHPSDFYPNLLASGFNIFTMVFIIAPLVICLTGIYFSLKKAGLVRIIFLTGFLFIIIEILLASMGKMGLMTRYTVIAFPSVILAVAYGLSNISRVLSYSLLNTYILINLIFLIFHPASASISPRDGYKKYIERFDSLNLTSKDVVMVPYGGKAFLDYYYNKTARVLPFDIENIYVVNKNLDIVFSKDVINSISDNKYENYRLLRTYISSKEPSKEFERYLNSEVFNKMEKGARFVLVISGGINSFNSQTLNQIASNDINYIQTPLFLMLSSKTTNDLLQITPRKLEFIKGENHGSWQLLVFKKG